MPNHFLVHVSLVLTFLLFSYLCYTHIRRYTQTYTDMEITLTKRSSILNNARYRKEEQSNYVSVG